MLTIDSDTPLGRQVASMTMGDIAEIHLSARAAAMEELGRDILDDVNEHVKETSSYVVKRMNELAMSGELETPLHSLAALAGVIMNLVASLHSSLGRIEMELDLEDMARETWSDKGRTANDG